MDLNFVKYTQLSKITTGNNLIDSIISLLIISILPMIQKYISMEEISKNISFFFNFKRSIKLITV